MEGIGRKEKEEEEESFTRNAFDNELSQYFIIAVRMNP